ncbi:MAG: hypothetical protein WKG00_27835 [Polyangiaceae bacterium]
MSASGPTYSTLFRLVACDHCGAPLRTEERGGAASCRYCGAVHSVAPRDDRPLSLFHAGAPLPEAERLARLRHQATRQRAIPSALAALIEHDEIPAWKLTEATQVWQATRREARLHGGTDAGERLLHLTVLISNAHLRSRAHDPARHRALLEAALDAVHLPRHRQVLRGHLSRAAASEGDLDAAEAWLAPCDRCSDDLESDSAWRITLAYIDTARCRFGHVLDLLGRTANEIPLASSAVPMGVLLRGNAHEQTGNGEAAVESLVAAFRGAGARVSLSLVREQHRRMCLCPRTFQVASHAHAAAAAAVVSKAAGSGSMTGDGWPIIILTALFVGVAAAAFIGDALGHAAIGLGVIFLVTVGSLRSLWRSRRLASLYEREAARQTRLIAEGAPAMARVIASAPTGVTTVERQQVHVEVQVSPLDSAPFRARVTLLLTAPQLAALAPDAAVTAWFDPLQPGGVALEVV